MTRGPSTGAKQDGVAPGTTIDTVNAGSSPLTVESDVVFLPPGYRPEVDAFPSRSIAGRASRVSRLRQTIGLVPPSPTGATERPRAPVISLRASGTPSPGPAGSGVSVEPRR